MRYFFNTSDVSCAHDFAGIDLVSAERARLEAVKLAGQMLLDAPEIVCGQELRIEVTDGEGNSVFHLITTGFDVVPSAFAGDAVCGVLRSIGGAEKLKPADDIRSAGRAQRIVNPRRARPIMTTVRAGGA